MNTSAAGASCVCKPTSTSIALPTTPVFARDLNLSGAPSVTMGLTGDAVTDAAFAAVASLVERVALPKGRRKRPSAQYVTALTAIVADLLRAASFDPVRYCYRSMTAAAFTGQRVGYDPCKRAMDDLARNGFLLIAKGSAPFKGVPGMVTRIGVLPALTDVLAAFGITPENRLTHFRYAPIATVTAPIRLKDSKTKGPRGTKIDGNPMLVDMSNPRVVALAEPVNAINAFMAKQHFSMSDSVQFYRGFNCGDLPDFAWNMGGRFNCVGGGYQMMPKEERAFIRINDLETTEIDVSACHLTTTYGLLGKSLPLEEDLYKVEGLPRPVVKLYVNYLLSIGRRPHRWAPDHGKTFNRCLPKMLGLLYPVSKIGKRICGALPILDEAIERGSSWSELQFIESNIIIETVHRLQQLDICALPVHDSIRVPVKDKDVAINMLASVFKDKTGRIPFLKED